MQAGSGLEVEGRLFLFGGFPDHPGGDGVAGFGNVLRGNVSHFSPRSCRLPALSVPRNVHPPHV